MECDITFEKPVLKDLEEIARFKKTESHYVGYALFTPSYLANLHDRLRIYPVKAGLNDHCGMFFLDKDKKLICDDLTIRPYTLKTLRSLCDLLQANVVLK